MTEQNGQVVDRVFSDLVRCGPHGATHDRRLLSLLLSRAALSALLTCGRVVRWQIDHDVAAAARSAALIISAALPRTGVLPP